MDKIVSMTEEEFTKAALEKGFDEHWIKCNRQNTHT